MRKPRGGIRDDHDPKFNLDTCIFDKLVSESDRNPIWVRNLKSTLKIYTLYFLGLAFPS